jgi:hypothetical protein
MIASATLLFIVSRLRHGTERDQGPLNPTDAAFNGLSSRTPEPAWKQ